MTSSNNAEAVKLLSQLLSRIHRLGSRDARAVMAADDRMRQETLNDADLVRLREIVDRSEG